MGDERAKLLQSLSKTIYDYRFSEVAFMTPEHIENWLCQFEVRDQPVILHEMNFIMKKFYISQQRAKRYVYEFIKTLVGSENPKEVLSRTYFLHKNQSGNSQEAMLALADEIILENYGFSIASVDIHDARNYVYIDDAIYTGNKLYYGVNDVLSILKNNTNLDKKLIIYVIAAHRSGSNYALERIKRSHNNIEIKLLANLIIDDNRKFNADIEIIWPELIRGDDLIEFYTSNMYTASGRKLETHEIFRPSGHILQERMFSSSQARKTVERAFLVKGIELIKGNQYPAPSIRPLGFMKLTSLGFGTLFVTYRNIANNCPLVLWWGDTTYPVTHPLGKWYPLFPRKTNGNAIM